MKTTLITIALLVVLCCMALRPSQSEMDRELAEILLESTEVQQVPLVDTDGMDTDGPPAFQAGLRTVLFFEREGMQGLIRGAIVIEEDHVIDLLIIQSREGIDHDTFDGPDFRNSIRVGPAKPPFDIDAISGATISSQAVRDAVNLRLEQWHKKYFLLGSS